jgi:hypothetical protein
MTDKKPEKLEIRINDDLLMDIEGELLKEAGLLNQE